jgi:predicted  nucleic acid-binding Zn-ribbon protein
VPDSIRVQVEGCRADVEELEVQLKSLTKQVYTGKTHLTDIEKRLPQARTEPPWVRSID